MIDIRSFSGPSLAAGWLAGRPRLVRLVSSGEEESQAEQTGASSPPKGP